MPPKSEKPRPNFIHYRVDGAHIGDVLATQRKNLGLSMQELADRAGVSPTTVMKLEHGEITVQFDKILQILDQLNLPLSAIIGYGDDGPDPLPDPLVKQVIDKLADHQLEDALLLIAEAIKQQKRG